MSFNLNLDGNPVKCVLTESQLTIEKTKTTESVEISDIIGVVAKPLENGKKIENIDVFIIQKLHQFKMKKKKLTFRSDQGSCYEFERLLKEKLDSLKDRPKRLLVMISPPAGKQQGEKIYRNIVAPIFQLAGITTEVVVSESPNQIHDFMSTYDYDKVDGFVVCGGDGSYNQMFVPLLERTQKEATLDYHDAAVELKPTPKPIGIIPTGTRNCSARISQGCTDPETAAIHIVKGNKQHLPVSGIYSDNKCLRFCSVFIGFGMSTELFYYTEDFRWMKTMRYLLVPIYYYLVKPHPVFNAKIKIYLRSDSDTKDQSVEDQVKQDNIIEIDGRYVDILMYIHDFLNYSYNFTSAGYKYNNCELNIYNTTYTSRRQLLGNYMRRMFNNSEDMVNPPYIQNYKISGYKVTVDMPVGSDVEFPYRIMADAEYVHLKNPEWEIRFKGPVVTVYSSLPTKT